MSARSMIVSAEVVLAVAGFFAYVLLNSGGALVGGLLFLGLALIMCEKD